MKIIKKIKQTSIFESSRPGAQTWNFVCSFCYQCTIGTYSFVISFGEFVKLERKQRFRFFFQRKLWSNWVLITSRALFLGVNNTPIMLVTPRGDITAQIMKIVCQTCSFLRHRTDPAQSSGIEYEMEINYILLTHNFISETTFWWKWYP